ncbi:MAG: L,D-transpeptidase family protein [Actinobacteria bacterium]|uniref:Unannotated protein n=1 Tax=freshwater metagenome TaxID=449393 RepID=A0A6J7EJV6_9ZZZZ|nr:L,D-transpeptidase family protein [Actinomycetota bacterium]
MNARRAIALLTCSLSFGALVVPSVASAGCRKAHGAPHAAPVVRLSISGVFRYHGRSFSASGEQVRLKGTVSGISDVTGERVHVRVYTGSQQIRSAWVGITDVNGLCSLGAFTYSSKIWASGRTVFKVDHPTTTHYPDVFTGRLAGLTVYKRASGFGANGTGVGVLLAMLRKLGYYAPIGSHYGEGTGKAVLTYRKVNRMSRIETPSARIYHLLQQGRGAARARYPHLGTHLEANLSAQVLIFFHGSRPVEVHPISSGKPSTPTVLGKYQFYMKDFGTNQKGMVNSSYFHNGYAVHGYAELPTYNASHGCLRVWVPSAAHIYNHIHIGEWIAVYW